MIGGHYGDTMHVTDETLLYALRSGYAKKVTTSIHNGCVYAKLCKEYKRHILYRIGNTWDGMEYPLYQVSKLRTAKFKGKGIKPESELWKTVSRDTLDKHTYALVITEQSQILYNYCNIGKTVFTLDKLGTKLLYPPVLYNYTDFHFFYNLET